MADKRIVLYVDEGLHRQVKGTAAREGMTMKGAVTDALNMWLDKILNRQADAKKGVIPLSEKNPETFAAALDFLRSFQGDEAKWAKKS